MKCDKNTVKNKIKKVLQGYEIKLLYGFYQRKGRKRKNCTETCSK